MRGVRFERVGDDGLEITAKFGMRRANGDGAFRLQQPRRCRKAQPFPRIHRLPGQAFMKQQAEAMDIGAQVDGIGALELLGRHVAGRSRNRSGERGRQSLVVRHRGDAKVDHLGVPVRVHQHVAGLDVAVHQPAHMAVMHAVAHHGEALELLRELGACLAPPLRDRASTLDQFHDHERQIAGLVAVHARREDARDRRVIQSRKRSRFPPESTARALAEQFRAEHLHGDGSRRPLLHGAVHATRATSPKQRLEETSADPLPLQDGLSPRSRRLIRILGIRQVAQKACNLLSQCSVAATQPVQQLFALGARCAQCLVKHLLSPQRIHLGCGVAARIHAGVSSFGASRSGPYLRSTSRRTKARAKFQCLLTVRGAIPRACEV